MMKKYWNDCGAYRCRKADFEAAMNRMRGILWGWRLRGQ